MIDMTTILMTVGYLGCIGIAMRQMFIDNAKPIAVADTAKGLRIYAAQAEYDKMKDSGQLMYVWDEADIAKKYNISIYDLN